MCDNSRTIRDVFIGYPGSVHDARVFRTSPLYTSLEVKCGDRIILADSAYPCLTNLMTPYRDTGHLTLVETNFNRRLSNWNCHRAYTFGILKQKFRQLYHLKLNNFTKILRQYATSSERVASSIICPYKMIWTILSLSLPL